MTVSDTLVEILTHGRPEAAVITSLTAVLICVSGFDDSVVAPAEDVAARKAKRNLQIRGAMDGVRHELERPAGQTFPPGPRELRRGVQQQGESVLGLIFSPSLMLC